MDAANQARNVHHGPRQAPAQRAVHLGLHSARNGLQLLPELLRLLVMLLDLRDGAPAARSVCSLISSSVTTRSGITRMSRTATGRRAADPRPAAEFRESPAANATAPCAPRPWPRSMRLASSISPSRVSSGTVPISRRYMRTGSLVLSLKILGQFQVAELLASPPASCRTRSWALPGSRRRRCRARSADRRARGRREVLGQQLVDLVVEDVALLFSGVHELFQPAEFFFSSHWRPAYQRYLGNPRKTDCGATEFLFRLAVRVAPFTLNPDSI